MDSHLLSVIIGGIIGLILTVVVLVIIDTLRRRS